MNIKLSLSLLAILVLTGCAPDNTVQNALTYTVNKHQFETVVEAKGHLIAANETIITAPASSRGPQTLAWLMPEYSQVKKGDVIARFDGEQMRRQSQKNTNKAALTAQDLAQKSAEIDKDKAILKHDIVLVNEEKQFAEDYSIEDERIRSKLDILESQQNVEFLNAKHDYYDWQTTRFEQSAAGELMLLKMQENQYKQKLEMLNTNLSLLEIIAPHDGLLTHSTNWRGEKPRAGETLWPGQKIAALPDVSQMQLVLYVSEREAIDLAPGQALQFQLIALPEQQFSGELIEVSPFPKSIKRGDPQKYYELKANITQQTTVLRPGLKLNARILVTPASERLVVPKQSVFTEQNAHYVYAEHGGEFIKTAVTLGKHNLSHVEILDGLASSDVVSLIDIKDI
ncbi:efflux RND transporter periplasmic adaptor subunit [Pseudoalteromonas sp. KG3]|uniref:efflux RND transporter periplasmic adaptor subunit n=1 Tax=Pseudoalteromonas TaxID=53246 RepID=UPI0026594333|nr:efflux RND transporter periplasmic adaptor subunit [Pseudoalteromonas sp. KG3]WKD25931.1 efflux RND transporter periplasmic adaptor subunit [Pseudoalteromonas sp. KG3]